jgi:Ala-tRNA(Pro) deacylase
MSMTEGEFLRFLDANNFAYQRIEHPAVFTCAEAELHRPRLLAVSTKNLFLCDKKKRHYFLVVTACEKTVRLESLSKQLGISHVRFGSEDDLGRLLGVTRGAVTMMGLVNDTEHHIALWIDDEIWSGEYFLCHPLVNTATLVLSKAELERFFSLTGHVPHFFNGKDRIQG